MDAIIAKHKKQKQKRNYFTQETEDAIVKYNNTKNFQKRSDIYQQYIHYPFYWFQIFQTLLRTKHANPPSYLCGEGRRSFS